MYFHRCDLKNAEELKEYMIKHLYYTDRAEYLRWVFSRDNQFSPIKDDSDDFTYMIDDIIEKGPIKAGVDRDYVIQKAKWAINQSRMFEINTIFALDPDRLRRIYNGFPHFIESSLSKMTSLVYLFNMPFFSKYYSITDDDSSMIFIYFGIMFDDRACKSILKKLMKDRSKTLSNILGYRSIKSLEKRIFHILKHYMNSPILPTFERLTHRSGEAFYKMMDRLLNTFVEYAYKVG